MDGQNKDSNISVSVDKNLSKYKGGFGTNVFVDKIAENPFCDHGPTVLFERILANGGTKKFYACSACRDRKLCSFYLAADDQYKPTGRKTTQIREQEEFFNYHLRRYKECKQWINKHPGKICFCVTCSIVVLPDQLTLHKDCTLRKNLSENQICFPSQILSPLSNSKSTAQYLFAEKSVNVILQLLKGIEVTKVICIGTPKIHEALQKESLDSLLLDIDQRFSFFNSSSDYLTYNLFNHHFYGGKKAKEVYSSFLKGKDSKLALIMDPPFGGRMELISNTLSIIQNEWRLTNNFSEERTLPMMLVFPYFLEKQVLSRLPTFAMLDYKVDYENHEKYTTGPKGMKNGSAVRIFVNLPPEMFPLPEDEGYWYCVLCCRWVNEKNFHCNKCGSCTSKDGRTYKHCNLCKRCVKPSWTHCHRCVICAPVGHLCSEVSKIKKAFSCHTCGEEGHKRRECEKRKQPATKNAESKKKRKTVPQSRIDERSRDLDILQQVLKS